MDSTGIRASRCPTVSVRIFKIESFNELLKCGLGSCYSDRPDDEDDGRLCGADLAALGGRVDGTQDTRRIGRRPGVE